VIFRFLTAQALSTIGFIQTGLAKSIILMIHIDNYRELKMEKLN
jgi:hypothetical protein